MSLRRSGGGVVPMVEGGAAASSATMGVSVSAFFSFNESVKNVLRFRKNRETIKLILTKGFVKFVRQYKEYSNK